MLNEKEREQVESWISSGVDWSASDVAAFIDAMDDNNHSDRMLYGLMEDGLDFDEEMASEMSLHHNDP